jgi:hypothetical protein
MLLITTKDFLLILLIRTKDLKLILLIIPKDFFINFINYN